MLVFQQYMLPLDVFVLILWVLTGVATSLARIEIDENETLNVDSFIRYAVAVVFIAIFWPWVVWANFLKNKVFK